MFEIIGKKMLILLIIIFRFWVSFFKYFSFLIFDKLKKLEKNILFFNILVIFNKDMIEGIIYEFRNNS